MTPTETLRAELADMERTHDEVNNRLGERAAERAAQLGPGDTQIRLRAARNLLWRTSVGTLLLFVVLLVGYVFVFVPEAPPTEGDIATVRMFTDRTIAEAADAGTPEDVVTAADAWVSVKHDAEYAPPITLTAGRSPYPGLRGHEIPYAKELDPAFRWAHIGAAACSVGQRELAGHALRVLTWQADLKNADGIPIVSPELPNGAAGKDRRISRLQVAAMTHCLLSSYGLEASDEAE